MTVHASPINANPTGPVGDTVDPTGPIVIEGHQSQPGDVRGVETIAAPGPRGRDPGGCRDCRRGDPDRPRRS